MSPPANLPHNTVVVDPIDPGIVYVGTDAGVWQSIDGAASWTHMGPENGLPNAIVSDLKLTTTTNRLVAFTFGRGAFTMSPRAPAFGVPGTGSLGFRGATAVTFTIQATGGGVLTGTCSAPAPFRVTSGSSLNVAAGSGQAVAVHLDPTSAGVFSGTLTCTTNAGVLTRTLLAAVFTDPDLVGQLTVIKLAHILQLRTLIDALRQNRGLAAFAWTDLSPAAGNTPVKRQHIVDLRSALNDVYTGAGLLPPTFTDPTLAASVTVIKAVHVTELRTAAQAVE